MNGARRLAGAAMALATAGIGLVALARSDPTAPIARASFDRDGSLALPVDYRRWVHIGTRLKPIGINILDGKPTKTPELFNAYVEPTAFDFFVKTGKWPDGAQIVKEFSAVRVGEGCDAQTMLCTSPLGRGLFEIGFVGLGMMVKDVARFPDGKGHWGYFSFGHKPAPYDGKATRLAADKCEVCHINLASDTDYVISRAHIGLARKGDARR